VTSELSLLPASPGHRSHNRPVEISIKFTLVNFMVLKDTIKTTEGYFLNYFQLKYGITTIIPLNWALLQNGCDKPAGI
jgi:hypothetical protein